MPSKGVTMRESVRWRWIAATAVAAVCVSSAVVGAAVDVPDARATHLAGGYYHYSINDYCPWDPNRRADPIMVMFYQNANSTDAEIHIKHHTGWDSGTGTTAYFQVESNCESMSGQTAENCCTSRYHIRWRQSPYFDFNYGTVTMATPHHENVEPCFSYHKIDQWQAGTGSGYDRGRAYIYQQFVGTAHTYGGLGEWGSTMPVSQCGQDVAGDGRVGWWTIP
jgi:hypothetical protein